MPKKNETLALYRAKRDFSVSPEPTGDDLIKKIKKSKEPVFVIQKHNASHLHYDVRLQIGDILVSWAVPKGPSLNPAEKRLAGVVMVWDLGTYESLKDESMQTSYKNGRIEVHLKGEKLEGNFALVRTGYGKGESAKKNWLLIKMKDEFASARKNPVSTQDKSVLSGKTTAQIKKS